MLRWTGGGPEGTDRASPQASGYGRGKSAGVMVSYARMDRGRSMRDESGSDSGNRARGRAHGAGCLGGDWADGTATVGRPLVPMLSSGGGYKVPPYGSAILLTFHYSENRIQCCIPAMVAPFIVSSNTSSYMACT